MNGGKIYADPHLIVEQVGVMHVSLPDRLHCCCRDYVMSRFSSSANAIIIISTIVFASDDVERVFVLNPVEQVEYHNTMFDVPGRFLFGLPHE